MYKHVQKNFNCFSPLRLCNVKLLKM